MRPSAAAFVAALLGACTEPSGPPPLHTPQIAYTVAIPSMGAESLQVSVVVRRWPDDTLRFLAPPIYADNPTLKQRRANFRSMRLTDSAGRPLVCTVDSVVLGLYSSLRVRATVVPPVTLDYTISFEYENDIMPLPGIGPDSGYLQGAFVFAIPMPHGEPGLAEIWRCPWEIEVAYALGPNVALFGDPPRMVTFRNAYELLFSTSAIGGTILAEGAGAGQMFRFVNLQDTVFEPALIARHAGNFAGTIADLVRLFGTLDHPLTVILGINRAGGLEGMYAFSIHNPWENDTTGWFPMVLAHEAAHCWIGLRVGEYDDPWWKEATTNYLGFLLALRRGLCTEALVAGALLADLSDMPDVRNYAMSSPRVRSHLFAPDSGMTNLVYTKGAQVCMLLDLAIRRATANAAGFDSLLGVFVRRYDGRAFRRTEYVGFLHDASGADIAGLFAQYVDAPGAIPVDVLVRTYDSLTAFGAFGTPSPPPREPIARHLPNTTMRW